ncbi:hydroxypyruvate isomerase family protein [Cerasicoccus arenae]|uniref:Hydroxypyruvate isomerase n=1 Tax=Cerasicoccus arenae TaxID=424488 RepID=A0A8J3DBP4_9BACT|nr:TIM barrel protein [Cerasicoccus arenae]MBK1859816.1 TIM barrel protein [Cerasicoccus arenae]GHC01556.1 hydroxypyruvate isomerase [Cerasicoccus arenae]
MSKIKQSFCWWSYAQRGVENEALLSAAKRIGYEGVELIQPELWPMAQDAGLNIVSIGGHSSINDGLNRPENAAKIERELRTNIELASEYGISNLICFSGNRNGLNDDTGLAQCAHTLEKVLPYAEKTGVKLIMELLNSKVDHSDYQCDHTDWGVALCEKINSPHFKLLYDIYHMQIMEGDIIRTIGKHHSHFAHFHTAGNPGRGPLDDNQELNYSGIFKAIAATSYTGYIGHEFLSDNTPVQSLESAFNLCQASLK